MYTTRWATCSANASSCETTIIVMCCSARRCMTASTSRTSSRSSAEVASSKSMSFGFMARERAIATRCCCPPDRRAGRASANVSMPTSRSDSRACSRASRRFSLRTFTSASITFSRAVICGKRLKCWNTKPTSPCRRQVLRTGVPKTWIWPPWIGSRPATQRSSVVLPEPLAPMMTTTSPRATSRRDAAEDLARAVRLRNGADNDPLGVGRRVERGRDRRRLTLHRHCAPSSPLGVVACLKRPCRSRLGAAQLRPARCQG